MTKLIAKIQSELTSFKKDESGATAIEYGLIAGGISLAIVGAVFLFGDELQNLFDTIGGAMETAATDAQTQVDDGAGT